MNLTRKIELAKAAIDSIATHDDEDRSLRDAALANLTSYAAAAASAAATRAADVQEPGEGEA